MSQLMCRIGIGSNPGLLKPDQLTILRYSGWESPSTSRADSEGCDIIIENNYRYISMHLFLCMILHHASLKLTALLNESVNWKASHRSGENGMLYKMLLIMSPAVASSLSSAPMERPKGKPLPSKPRAAARRRVFQVKLTGVLFFTTEPF